MRPSRPQCWLWQRLDPPPPWLFCTSPNHIEPNGPSIRISDRAAIFQRRSLAHPRSGHRCSARTRRLARCDPESPGCEVQVQTPPLAKWVYPPRLEPRAQVEPRPCEAGVVARRRPRENKPASGRAASSREYVKPCDGVVHVRCQKCERRTRRFHWPGGRRGDQSRSHPTAVFSCRLEVLASEAR